MDRKEAIEIVRLCCPRIADSKCDFETAMRVLVPELKESEDERMIKEIIAMVEEDWPGRSDVIAWLEKQGKKAFSVERVFAEAGIKPAYKDGNSWCVLIGKNIQEGICGFGETPKDAYVNFLKELWGKAFEQNPAWSEEDREMRMKVLKYLSTRCNVFDYEEVDNWLKSLKERVQSQPKQEWSEEDEQYLLVCKNALAKYQTTDKWDAGIISHWLEDKLKSLKDRVQSRQDLHPRYIEGKGIYVPIIDVVLNMLDELGEMTWDEAKNIALSKEQMFVVLYYKDEINALLKKHGGQILEGWHWTSTQSSNVTYAWPVYFDTSCILSGYARSTSFSVRGFSAYHPES